MTCRSWTYSLLSNTSVCDSHTREEIRDKYNPPPPGGGGFLCGPKGCGFSAVLVINRVSILAYFGHK